MPMRLACTGMVSRIEEAKQFLAIILICLQASIGCLQIILLQQVSLLLEVLCGEDKVVWDDWEFVQNQEMGGRERRNKETGWRTLEGIEWLG